MDKIKIYKTPLINKSDSLSDMEKFKTKDAVFIYGDKDIDNRLELQKPVSATDYAIMCGACLGREKNVAGKRPTLKFLRTPVKDHNAVYACDIDGDKRPESYTSQDLVICPVLNVNIESFLLSGFASNITQNSAGQHIVTIGLNFPKSYAGKDISAKLFELYDENKLPKTGATYTGFMQSEETFGQFGHNLGMVPVLQHVNMINQNDEYQYGNERYVLTAMRGEDNDNLFGKPFFGHYWVKVEPIVFKINNWDNLPTSINPNGRGTDNYIELETEEGIMAGIPFNPTTLEENGVCENRELWQNSFIRAWLNGYNLKTEISNGNGNIDVMDKKQDFNFKGEGFLFEASQSGNVKVSVTDEELKTSSMAIPNLNPYDFDFSTLSNDELLKEYIKARVPVFLHGVSGVGKSSRVKEIDPDATRITLRPGMNAEEVDGTLDRETGKYIPPLWYQQLCEKCKAEPDKMHVLFIDEITNVKPTVQSLIYSIVLERAGKDGLWPLPENCVVVGAGNETAGNLSAYPLTNALFRRFCHIYYEVDKNEWLKWATGVKFDERQDYDKNKISDEDKDRARIHPSIVAFISSRKDDVLYQELDEEEPTIVTDPRKWEIASNVLYSTKNPNALVPAIGRELTIDFSEFVSSVAITVNDILTDNFSKSDIEKLDLSKRLSTIAGLTSATVKDLPEVREFISEYFGKELLATFDTMWVRNDPERALVIQSFENSSCTADLNDENSQENKEL